MKCLKIKSKWLEESDLRLDAEFHLSDGPLTKLKFKKSPFPISTLSLETTEIFKGNIFRRTYVKSAEKGYQFMTASDMMKPDILGEKYVSKKHTKTANLFLKEGWVLVSRSGTLGNTVYTNKEFEGVLGTDDLIRIIPDEKKMPGGFLFAYLSSKYGYGLLTQSGYGGVIQHIEPHHLNDLPVPVFPIENQMKISKLIEEAAELRVEANNNLKKAKKLFEKYDQLKGDTIFKIKRNELKDSWLGRNNKPEIIAYDKLVEKDGFEFLDFFSENIFAPNMFKHIYIEKDNGYRFFNGAEISKSRRSTNRFLSKRGVVDIKNYVVDKDWLLIYRHGPRNGMLGDVFIVDEYLSGSCLSDLVIRVCPKTKEYSHWLYTFFKTKIGREILHNIASGSAILFLSPQRLSKIKVPYENNELDIKTNFKLISKHIESLELANNKENEAIQMIEKEIESWQK